MHRFYLLLTTLLCFAGTLGSAEPNTISAVYAHNTLSFTVPYEAVHSGEAVLRLEVLDPEDHVIGQTEHHAHVAEGSVVWNAQVELHEPMPLAELIWQRTRFTLAYDNQTVPDMEDIRSLSEILVRPVMHILAQRSYIAGAQAAMRVIVESANHDQVAPIGQGTIRIELIDSSHGSGRAPMLLFAGSLDHRGSVGAQFRFPAGLMGSFPVRFTVETPLGQVQTTETVQLEDQVSVLLTSEKPVYQPSQTIHLRALALNRADHHAIVASALTFEAEDSRGNRVFRRVTQTDSFGVASAEFTLADEVNLGAYHFRVKMGDAHTSAADLTVNVERYVLPKFRVMIDFDAKDGKPTRDYRPGEHVTGSVKANYFFGKPVANATVNIKASAMDVELFDAATTEGRTNGDGIYHFDFVLPRFFAGDGNRHGAAPVVVEATVKDVAEHAETRGEPITVSDAPLLITAIPEGGKLVLGLQNEVYILASYPDGTPAKADIQVRSGRVRQTAKTDEAGIATIPVTGDEASSALRIEADDHKGNRTSQTLTLETRTGEDQLLVRTARAVVKPGDKIQISVLSTRQTGAAYIDLVHEGQTILTRDADIENGKAELSLIATPAMSGTLAVTGYVIGRNGGEISDQRLIFVQPAEDLHIDAVADAASYLPGGEARVRFHVTNQKGEGVSAAFGVEVVDQAVFALAEKQPGFAKVFFYLEQELMKPHYEIHSLSPTQIVEPHEDESSESRDRAAQVLFAAAETVAPYTLDSEAGRALPDTEMSDYQQRYRDALVDYVRELAANITDIRHKQDVPSAFMALKDASGHSPRDAWDTGLRIEPAQWFGRNNGWYLVRSAGPDREFNTADDLTLWLEPESGTASAWGSPTQREGTITVRTEHDRGPDNGACDIVGTVTDVSGAVIPGAHIQILRTEDGRSREGTADAAGQFSFSALSPGHYRVRADSPGFQASIRTISLAARDRGVLSAVLEVGAVAETVEVAAAALPLETDMSTVSAGSIVQVPLMGRNVADRLDLNERAAMPKAGPGAATPTASPSAHIRSYFPEALYINPEILTDGNGKASIEIPLADSITTWRMAMFASTRSGALGTGTSDIKVFQDFFVDLDLPVTLTQGDKVSIPVAVYNYADHGGDVNLELKPEDWFSLDSPDKQSVSVAAGQLAAAQFTIEAKKIGKFKLMLTGRMRGGSEREDTVVREIEIVPNGEAKEIVFNGRLENEVRQTVRFPESAMPDASEIFVRLYPGPLSQIIEGMDGILRMPYGCFEQTSSSTYPNVLALDYMKRTKKVTPEIHAKAEGFIATGYQRLLTFEVPGGGFSWFGNAPANKILTAYGLMEFHDMSRVYDVDPEVIARTRDWLVRQQLPNGGWKPDSQFINEGATNRFNTDTLRITAYIAWALESTEYKGPAIDKARQFIAEHLDGKMDAYTLAVVANFAVEDSKDSDLTHRSFEMLRNAATEKGESVWWTAPETGVFATGDSAAVETTGLAVQAFLKAGQYSDVVRKALAWITSKKNGDGNWGTTQATIMALRALLAASEQSASDAHGVVDVMLNGTKVESLEINKGNNDLLHQFVLPPTSSHSGNEIQLQFSGEGGMAYQIAGRYFVPWQQQTTEPLAIAVAYDRTRLAQDQVVTSTATIRNNTDKTANMVMVDLGIPPGFDLLSEDLQDMVQKTANAKSGRLEKFSMTATQAILYFDSIASHDSFKIHFRLQAKYPIRAEGFTSRVYEYYDPNVSATTKPTQFVVNGR
ncbi:MAG TPA: carboxypeptidase regulatory-like domain-containing protein [Candidatus Acidoferrales bacterium]|nr:carboxypeptidase regulatory-like domain-containing protein [Candidatus Acidoferrales bacterium]